MIDRKGAALAVCLALAAAGAQAVQTPRRINIQGRLSDSAHAPRSGVVNMRFSLYNVPSGGTSLYDEPSGAGYVPVTVSSGLFSVQIGTINGMGVDLFSGASAYVGVTVSGDAEMTPRIPLVATPYAFTAMQLVQENDIRVNAGISYATFTAAGDLLVPNGVAATTGSFTGGVTASTGLFTGGGGLKATYGLAAASATVSGGLTASSGTFLATGSTQYSIRTSSGVDIQAGTLLVEGSGGLEVSNNMSAANFGLVCLASVTLTGAAATLDTGTFPARKHLVIIVDTPALTLTGGIARLQFNGDATASNYNDTRSDNNGAVTSNTGGTAQISLHEASAINGRNSRVDVMNISGQVHPMVIHTTIDQGALTAPIFTQGGGVYRDTAQITRVVLSNSGIAVDFPAGARLLVFGSND